MQTKALFAIHSEKISIYRKKSCNTDKNTVCNPHGNDAAPQQKMSIAQAFEVHKVSDPRSVSDDLNPL